MTALDERFIEERFVRASGPGGQNVNKVATAVELRFDVAAADLSAAVKSRLVALAGHRMTSDGRLLIDSRTHRTQAQNREAARERLLALIAQASIAPRRRRATRPPSASKEARLSTKRKRSAVKSGRGRQGSSDD